MTDQELLSLDRITADDASAYLHIPPQGCRTLARSGKIGEPILGTNRVMFQPYKMIRFKRGDDDEAQMRRLADIFRASGLSDVATKVAVALTRLADEGA